LRARWSPLVLRPCLLLQHLSGTPSPRREFASGEAWRVRVARHFDAIAEAIFDLVFSFFPVFVLLFVLLLLRTPDKLGEMSDVLFLCATLFAEGWVARSREEAYEVI
jgi:hypothetical protein